MSFQDGGSRWLFAIVVLGGACTPKSNGDDIKADVAAPTSKAASGTVPSAGGRLVVTPAEADGDAISMIRAARLKAKADGRVLVVYVSATWCNPCKKLKAEVEAGHLDERLGTTTLLAFDADKDAERLLAAGYSFSFVPFVALPGPDGHPADSVQAKGGGNDAWKELLGKLDAWQSAGPK